MRRRQLAAAGAPRSSRVSSPTANVGAAGALTRRRSVFGHGTTAATCPSSSVNLGRRNTVVGGGALECPTPLSLRDIYQLSRRGSTLNRHAVYSRRLSTFAVFQHHEKDGGATASRAGVARCESGRSRRLAARKVSVDSELRSYDGVDDDATTPDVRRRRSDATDVEQKQSPTNDQSLDSDRSQQSPTSRRNQDNAVRDALKTHTFDILLVSFCLHNNYRMNQKLLLLPTA